jgi:hypothetical protein
VINTWCPRLNAAKRSCQRQTQVLDLPVRLMIARAFYEHPPYWLGCMLEVTGLPHEPLPSWREFLEGGDALVDTANSSANKPTPELEPSSPPAEGYRRQPPGPAPQVGRSPDWVGQELRKRRPRRG